MTSARVPVLAIVLAATIGYACGGSDDPALGPSNVVGEWTGTTSQQKDLAFTVTSGGVTHSTFTYVLQGSRCFYTQTLAIPTTGPITVTNGHFTVPSTQLGVSTFVSATGDFVSDSQATGTLRVEDGNCGDTLSLTWSAKRN